MTREEQIIGESQKQVSERLPKQTQQIYKAGFLNGALWADANRWVRVEDGLPEIEMGWSKKDVWIATKYNFYIGRLRDGEWVDMLNNPLAYVTHWQYITLPEPPKAEQWPHQTK